MSTNTIQTLSVEQVEKELPADAGGTPPRTRVISPIAPVAVRQDDPVGPVYQEALGYRFLIQEAKFPSLVRMDDGALLLSIAGMRKPSTPVDLLKSEEFILRSDDDGLSWSQPRRIPGHRTRLTNLGGAKLMLWGFRAADEAGTACFWFSDDAGRTWSEPEPVPALPDGRAWHTDVPYTSLVEGDVVSLLGWAELEGYRKWTAGAVFTQGVLRRYHLGTKTWDEPYLFPEAWGLNEGSLTRAEDGDLVAAFRTQMLDTPIQSDHYMGIATSRSRDNGKTWGEPARHFRYGHVHQSLLNLPDGRILMTYAARIGQLEGRCYHGIEAVVSHDHGKTWDWERRCILFRWPEGCMHSPRSVLLSDGRVLTIFMHHTRHSWSDSDIDPQPMVMAGLTSVVIWALHWSGSSSIISHE